MKSAILLFTMLLLLVSSAFAQDMTFVLKQSGDSLWVKDDADFSGQNTLYSLMNSDSLAPASRVYVLHNGGVYSIVNNSTGSANHQTIIMGETNTSLKTSTGGAPPVLQGAVYPGGSSTGGMNSGGDLLVKNCDIEIGNSAGGIGWGFFGFAGASMRLQVDNCIIEHNLWTVVGGPPAHSRIYFNNDYFVNLDGHTCRRNGGVLDFFSDQDTISVQNCTHVNVQGSSWKSRPDYIIKKILFNHNDFINCSGFVMMNSGADKPNFSVTNNIFVNVQLQGFAPPIALVDVGEVDPDNLPMGLVNLKPDSVFLANGGSFYADKNLVYWDPSLSNIVTTLNSGNGVDGSKQWVSQMIEMNSRTAAVVADKATYPKVNVLGWIENTKPTFKKTDVLFTTGLATLKTFSIATVDTTFTGSLASWRQATNLETDFFTYADWPIPIDLSYTDASLLTAGMGGFPIGDLGWFPAAQYASWKAQESTELAHIQNVLNTGQLTAVRTTEQLPQKFQLGQNYPNPFNPSTVISYSIAKAGNVTLKVYNMLGQEVATLVNGYQAASSYDVNFNASSLSSGVYLYELRTGSNSIIKKMTLMK
jgi:hypothetical protein